VLERSLGDWAPVTQRADLGVGDLRERVDALATALAARSSVEQPGPEASATIEALLDALEQGIVRAAERAADGRWSAVSWVKRGILAAFRVGTLVDQSPREASGHHVGPFSFIDKDTMHARAFDVGDGVRVVAGGTTIRRGAHVAAGVVCMPPAFVNVGAHVDADTMIDSHALIGSCAQVGARVHVSAGAQIGGVLEPINAAPVIIEDEVVIGGNCGVYEGAVVRARAVLGAGVVLTRSTPVYDLVRETVYRASDEGPLEIPPGAVVVPGARRVGSAWGASQGLALQTPVVVKYRDEKTDASATLEAWLR
jgi:2,3,4,5-tetrahydropyridine-2,6-dicarboxylate N-succinyltransferase